MKTILITGASSGIGAACALKLAQVPNTRLLLIARRESKLQAVAEQIAPTMVRTALVDVSDKKAVLSFFESIPEEWAPDVLINSAGFSLGLDKAQDATLEDWEQMIDTNLKGTLYCTHAALPHMLKRQDGHIVMLGSLAGHQPYAGGSVYCATKAAVLTFSQALKMDLLGTGIRVTSVDPGMVNTEFSQVRFKGDHKRAEAVYTNMQPLTAEDVAESIAFCIQQPAHINISNVLLMPTDQSGSGLVHRKES